MEADPSDTAQAIESRYEADLTQLLPSETLDAMSADSSNTAQSSGENRAVKPASLPPPSHIPESAVSFPFPPAGDNRSPTTEEEDRSTINGGEQSTKDGLGIESRDAPSEETGHVQKSLKNGSSHLTTRGAAEQEKLQILLQKRGLAGHIVHNMFKLLTGEKIVKNAGKGHKFDNLEPYYDILTVQERLCDLRSKDGVDLSRMPTTGDVPAMTRKQTSKGTIPYGHVFAHLRSRMNIISNAQDYLEHLCDWAIKDMDGFGISELEIANNISFTSSESVAKVKYEVEDVAEDLLSENVTKGNVTSVEEGFGEQSSAQKDAKIAQLETENAQLEAKVAQLETKNALLEAKVAELDEGRAKYQAWMCENKDTIIHNNSVIASQDRILHDYNVVQEKIAAEEAEIAKFEAMELEFNEDILFAERETSDSESDDMDLGDRESPVVESSERHQTAQDWP